MRWFKRSKLGTNYTHDRDKLVRKLKAGDHIATKRMSGRYEHHGIYEGRSNGYPSVIHLTKGVSKLPHCPNNCGYEPLENGGRAFSCIDCFSQRKKMFKLQYRTKNDLLSHVDASLNLLKTRKVISGYRERSKKYLEHYDEDQLFGHLQVPMKKNEDQVRLYQIPSSKSGEEVLKMARSNEPNLEYDFWCNNCEHFAVFCKTGKRQSVQLRNKLVPNVCKNGRLMTLRNNKVVPTDTEP